MKYPELRYIQGVAYHEFQYSICSLRILQARLSICKARLLHTCTDLPIMAVTLELTGTKE